MGETARCVDGCLRVQPVINDICQKTRVTVGLVLPAHHAKRHQVFTFFFQHCRDDGVHRALAASRFIWMAFLQREPRTAVLKQYSELV